MAFDFTELGLNLQRAHSRRIALRPASLADAWPLFHATRNPLFNRHLLWPQPELETSVLERMDLIVDAAFKGRLTALSAVVKATGEWIGLFRFQPRDEPGTLEMGVWIHDRFWHGRYSAELGRLCVDAAFALSDVQRLVGACAPANRGSCSLMGAVGMSTSDLVLRDSELGVPVLLQEYTIEREHWAELQPPHPAFDTFRGNSYPFVVAANDARPPAAASSSLPHEKHA